MPASTNTSTSPSFWQVMPMAPASICIRPIAGILCVLMCGRLAMACRERCACTRRMLSRMMSRSTVTAGVSRSATEVMASFPVWRARRPTRGRRSRHQRPHGSSRPTVRAGGSRSGVADLDRVHPDAVLVDDDLLGAHALGDRIVDAGLEIDLVGGEAGHAHALTVRESSQIRHEGLDHEDAVVGEVLGDPAEAADPILLREQAEE